MQAIKVVVSKLSVYLFLVLFLVLAGTLLARAQEGTKPSKVIAKSAQNNRGLK